MAPPGRWTLAAALGLLVASCTRPVLRPATSEVVEATGARLERGEYLVDVVSACGVCHTGRAAGDFVFDGESSDQYLAGGYSLTLPEMGLDLYFPNLTPDRATGLGAWSDDEVMRAIRDGVSRDGRLLVPAMPFRSYRAMSDEDTRAIVAWLRSVPGVRSEKPRASRVRGIPGFLLRHGAEHRAPVTSVTAPDRRDAVAYGGYLVRVAGCPDCHARKPNGVMRASRDPLWMAGGAWDDLPGVGRVYMRNLTPDRDTGLGRFDAKQIANAMRSGRRLDGKRMAPPMSLYMSHWSALHDEDLDAIVAYLQALPPARNPIKERELDPSFRKEFEHE